MIREFSKRTGIPEIQILGNSRTNRLSDARHLYWLLLFENGFSYRQIAELNDRARVSVFHGIKRIRELLEVSDTKVTKMYNLVKDIER